MKQPSLFDDDPVFGADLPVVGVPGGRKAPTPARKRFDKLIAGIGEQRQRLQQWRDFVPQYRQRVAADIEPLQRRLRQGRTEMVRLLDRAMDDQALGRTHRAKLRDLLLGQVAGMLAEETTEELVRLHDKYADLGFEEARKEDLDLAHAMASEIFGVDLGDDHGATTPDELAERIAEKLHATQQAGAAERARRRARGAKPGAKAAAKQAQREQAVQGASRSLREVYRKLASDLHPDREADAAERARKTALMQRVNQAYEAGDLLALLELQLGIEQIDPGALAGLAEDRLAHYNLVLQEQLQRLQDEIAEITAPFLLALGRRRPRELTPATVLGDLALELGELRATVQQIEADLQAFQDIRVLKRQLRDYRIGQQDDGEIDALELMLLGAAVQGRRRRR